MGLICRGQNILGKSILLQIEKNNYNKKKDAARSAHSKELLMQGKLTWPCRPSLLV